MYPKKSLENYAFLDITLPNYDNKERFCNFYEIKNAFND